MSVTETWSGKADEQRRKPDVTDGGMSAAGLPHIVSQYAEEASFLVRQRTRAVMAPNLSLIDLGWLDERIGAHLQGLAVSAVSGKSACDAAIAEGEWGALFAALVLALESGDRGRVDSVIALAEETPSLRAGVTEALAWVSRRFLQGTVKRLLGATSAFQRGIGMTCCAAHGVDAGQALNLALAGDDPPLRAQALRVAGELGRIDLRPICEHGLNDPDADCRLTAASASVLLGNRSQALEFLIEAAISPGPNRARAFALALSASTLGAAHRVLQRIRDLEQHRWLIQGSGIAGDPAYVPWLIGQMESVDTARVAGEAFSLITGVILVRNRLQRAQPEGFESGPNDDPEQSDVAMDPDEGLPWPDRGKVETWWTKNSGRFARGRRYFMGAPVSTEECVRVLNHGYQRQRVAAAQHLVLLEAGSPMFNTGAPTWRQRQLLGEMM